MAGYQPGLAWGEHASGVVKAGGLKGFGVREDLGARGEESPREVSEMPAAGRAQGGGEAAPQVRVGEMEAGWGRLLLLAGF